MSSTIADSVQPGDLVSLRGRESVVEAIKDGDIAGDLSTVELACLADDAQGELYARSSERN